MRVAGRLAQAFKGRQQRASRRGVRAPIADRRDVAGWVYIRGYWVGVPHLRRAATRAAQLRSAMAQQRRRLTHASRLKTQSVSSVPPSPL
jgi:hypothetical protein